MFHIQIVSDFHLFTFTPGIINVSPVSTLRPNCKRIALSSSCNTLLPFAQHHEKTTKQDRQRKTIEKDGSHL